MKREERRKRRRKKRQPSLDYSFFMVTCCALQRVSLLCCSINYESRDVPKRHSLPSILIFRDEQKQWISQLPSLFYFTIYLSHSNTHLDHADCLCRVWNPRCTFQIQSIQSIAILNVIHSPFYSGPSPPCLKLRRRSLSQTSLVAWVWMCTKEWAKLVPSW